MEITSFGKLVVVGPVEKVVNFQQKGMCEFESDEHIDFKDNQHAQMINGVKGLVVFVKGIRNTKNPKIARMEFEAASLGGFNSEEFFKVFEEFGVAACVELKNKNGSSYSVGVARQVNAKSTVDSLGRKRYGF